MMGFERNAAVLALALMLFGGCASQSGSTPMAGIFGDPSKDFDELRAAGFTHVVAAPEPQNLDSALTNGLGLIALAKEVDPERLPAAVRKLTRHEALWGWYLLDEPDLHRVPPHEIQKQNARIKQHTSKPTLLMLSSGVAAEHYASIPDTLAFDWYPIPWAPVATLNRELRFARIAAAGKPFYAALQAFSWEAFPHLVRTESPFRAPTEEELRCMAYLSFLHGAKGILFYTYSEPGWELREHPQLWSALTNVVAEVSGDLPLFEKRVGWWPAEIDYEGGPSRMFNEIHDSRVLAGLFEVEDRHSARAPGFYFMLVNTSAAACEFRFKFPMETDYLVSTANGKEILFSFRRRNMN